jgi:molybdenum cofactor guanylyltransferase
VPTDLVARLYESLLQHDAALAAAHDGTRLQPLFALLARELLPDLQAYLAAGGRRVTSWFTRQRLTAVSFADQADAFWNINDPTAQRAFEHQLIGSYP